MSQGASWPGLDGDRIGRTLWAESENEGFQGTFEADGLNGLVQRLR